MVSRNHLYGFALLPILITFLSCAHGWRDWYEKQIPPNLTLQIKCDKTKYLTGETIWIDILLINDGNDTVDVWYPKLANETTDVAGLCDGKDSIVTGSASWIDPGNDAVQTLAPGDTAYNIVDLDPHFYYPIDTNIDWRTFIEPPVVGWIDLQAIYMQKYKSNVLHFEILKPDSSDTTLCRLLSHQRRNIVTSVRIAALKQILYLYPGTDLAADACGKLMHAYNGYGHSDPRFDADSVAEYASMILCQFPSSGHAYRALVAKLWGIGKEERNVRLNNLGKSDIPWRLHMIIKEMKTAIRYISM